MTTRVAGNDRLPQNSSETANHSSVSPRTMGKCRDSAFIGRVFIDRDGYSILNPVTGNELEKILGLIKRIRTDFWISDCLPTKQDCLRYRPRHQLGRSLGRQLTATHCPLPRLLELCFSENKANIAITGATVPHVGISRDGHTFASFCALERKLTDSL